MSHCAEIWTWLGPGPLFANAQQQLSRNSYRFEFSYKFKAPQDLMQSGFAFLS